MAKVFNPFQKIGDYLASRKRKRRIREAVETVSELGLQIVKLKTIGNVQYIESNDGSWRRVGGKVEDPSIREVLSSIDKAAKIRAQVRASAKR